MRRLLIFTGLFQPLVLFAYILSDQLWRDGLPGMGGWAWLLGFAYLLALIPAWLTAAADGALSGQPLYVRLIATMAVAAILAELVARFAGQPSSDLPVAMAGEGPAMVCSWLAGLKPA